MIGRWKEGLADADAAIGKDKTFEKVKPFCTSSYETNLIWYCSHLYDHFRHTFEKESVCYSWAALLRLARPLRLP